MHAVRTSPPPRDSLMGSFHPINHLAVPSFSSSQMQSWIDQAKDKLNDIIAQAKRDDPNLQLRVAFVG